MHFPTVSKWLEWIKSLHLKQMDLGLARVEEVAKRMSLLPFSCPVITVAGTNGKGSTVAGLEAIFLESGYRVGVFTSPYLFRINEEIRILGSEVTDQSLCEAYERVENARQEITLTLFEYNTLAALDIFYRAKLDVCILEVGLGGRLDAVNVVDADLAIVASIGIDHSDLLGDTRDKIASEKAGIFRSGKPAICGDFEPPQTLIDYAKKINAPLYSQNQQFGYTMDGFEWNWWSEKNRFEMLPPTRLAIQNMSTVLMAIELFQQKLPVKRTAIDAALKNVTLIGRIQVIEGDVTKIFDVSHNPIAVEFLAKYLESHPIAGKSRAVFSMLADKDITGSIWEIKEFVDNWYIAPLSCERAASLAMLEACFRKVNFENVNFYDSITAAYQEVLDHSKKGDRVIVFGSFYTVSEVISFGR